MLSCEYMNKVKIYINPHLIVFSDVIPSVEDKWRILLSPIFIRRSLFSREIFGMFTPNIIWIFKTFTTKGREIYICKASNNLDKL